MAVALVMSLLCAPGCLEGAVLALAVHAVKSAREPKSGVGDAKQIAYEKYRSDMERNNLERREKSLPALAILSYDDWLRQQEMLQTVKEGTPSAPSEAVPQEAPAPFGEL
jgi:hypothetical protein